MLTRPDLVAQMHDEFFAVGVDAVETATFGAFPLVLNEYGIADKTLEINRRAAEIAREVASGYSHARPAPVRHRLDRARAPGCRRSARSPTRSCATATSSRSTG